MPQAEQSNPLEAEGRVLTQRIRKIQMRTRSKYAFHCQTYNPTYSDRLQIYGELYIGGGNDLENGEGDNLARFMSLDSRGKSVELQAMKQERGSFTLFRGPSCLIALRGVNFNDLNSCENYLVPSNKWRQLPPLNIGRQLPGSVLPKSMRAFCFCGS